MNRLFCMACLLFVIRGFSQHPYELSAVYEHHFSKNLQANDIGFISERFDHTNSRNTNGANKSSWSLGITYTFSSAHSGEAGITSKGFGTWIGYHYGIKYGISGNLYGGARAGFRFNNTNAGDKFSLFIPSIEFGYHYTSQDFGKGGAFTPFISLGYPVTMKGTDKLKAIYEKPAFSTGITVGYRF